LTKENNNSWYVIINPHAGSKKTQDDWPKIRRFLEREGFEIDCIFTEYQYHATDLTISAIQDNYFTKIIVVGGDGTLNEVLNGIFLQKRRKTTEITVGVISVGTGNDWGKMYNMPSDYYEQVRVIKNNNIYLQDVGKVTYLHHDERKEHYFLNIAGMGFDALVAKKTNIAKQKGSGGTLSYLINLVVGLFQFKFNYVHIENEEGKIFSGRIFSMNIGICSYNGGGMKQLPYAVSNDGLFDVTVIRKVSRMKVIRNIKNLYDGSFIKIKEVETFTGKQFEVTAKPQKSVYLETDGESLGNSPLLFTILPLSIKLIIK
jgi:YegS/Rv2252/BmrU family lipid kinase